MENKKLINILLKDMEELEELIAEIKLNKMYEPFEMEFIHTRVKGILQLMRLLDSRNIEHGGNVVDTNEETIERNKDNCDDTNSSKKQKFENVIDIHDDEFNSKGCIDDEKFIENSEEEKNVDKENENMNHVEVKEDKTEEMIEENVNIAEKKIDEEEEMLEEDTEKSKNGATIGDSFFKEKSVNDSIIENNKLVFKLSNRPVENLRRAIGINDRFLYMRELFDGDNQKFQETIDILDEKSNLKEAVEYLRDNYRWKKNETSLKFVSLVKRRFLNE